MADLHAQLTQATAGQGQVVGIVGELGIGKSRLLYEFRRSLSGEDVTYVEGHCQSYGSTSPYLPVLDLLRHQGYATEAGSSAGGLADHAAVARSSSGDDHRRALVVDSPTHRKAACLPRVCDARIRVSGIFGLPAL